MLRLIFVSQHERPTEFRVLYRLNDRQATFGWDEIPALADGAYTEPYADLAPWDPSEATSRAMAFTSQLEELQWFRLWTDPLEPGYYDLALLVVPDFRVTASEAGYFTTYRPFLRGAVYVGPMAPLTREYPILDPAARPIGGEHGDMLLFCTEPYHLRMRSSADVAPGEAVTLHANWAPSDLNLSDNQLPESSLPTAFVGFIEDRRVPINGELVIYGAGGSNAMSYLPTTITAPTAPGRHQCFLQQFSNPYRGPAYAMRPAASSTPNRASASRSTSRPAEPRSFDPRQPQRSTRQGHAAL